MIELHCIEVNASPPNKGMELTVKSVTQDFEVVVDEIRGLVAEGRLDDAAAVFFGREAGLSENELSELRDAPFWPQIAELAPTLVREWDAIFAFNPTVERYRELSMPT